jgi:GNAT superfamily N-acetyltransferase
MTLPSIQTLYDVTEATWPQAAAWTEAGFTIRDGKGGGKRVSAATLEGSLSAADIEGAETAMHKLGQNPLIKHPEGEDDLDLELDQRGYDVIDPVNAYAISAADIARKDIPRTVAIPAWEPLRIMEEMWASGGIGPARIDVMRRACSPKTGIVSRFNDKPAGTSFIAMHQGITMLHALEIVPNQRRNGLGRWAMHRAGVWTLENGGHTVSVLCTKANDAANGLYQSLGMSLIGAYHYRIKPE